MPTTPPAKPQPPHATEPVHAEHLRPGDEAPPGTPGTGENLCKRCNGSGRVKGEPCPDCEGTGQVNVGIGGA